jgi:hypothetical protein
LGAGDTVTCAFTNTQQGSIKIVKNTVGGDDTFNFTSNFGVSAITTNSNTGSQTVNNLSAGSSYNISEQAKTGWDSGTFSCDHGTAAAIQVLAGQTTTCSITNTQQGSIKIVKNTVGGDGTFNFTSTFGVSAIPTSGNTGSQTVSNLSPGTGYSISEQAKTGWDSGTFSCDHGTASAIQVLAGQTTTCSITNTQQGSIKIVKNTVGGDDTFSFTSNFGVSSIPTSGNTGSQTVNNLSAGSSYNISEQAKTGWDAGTFSCDHGTASAIQVLAGQTTTCTITNTQQQGSIKIVKNTVGGNDAFSFNSNFGVTSISTSGNTGSQTVNNLSVVGNYSISEQPKTGWDAGTFSCDHGTASAIQVLAGQTTTCSITNTQQGSIKIVKNTVGGNDTFNFISNFGVTSIATSGNTGSQTVSNLSAGSGYSISEQAKTGWDSGTFSCDHGTASAIQVLAGQTTTCSITNTQQSTQQGSIKIVKNTVGGNDTFNFISNFGVSSITTSGNTGSQTVSNLSAGSGYSISEQAKAGWDLTSAICDHGTIAAVQVLAGQQTTCTFTNTTVTPTLPPPPTLTIIKNSRGGQAMFTFAVTGPTASTPSITTVGSPNGTGQYGPVTIDVGSYTVSETTLPLGWTMTGITCDTGSAGADTNGDGIPDSWNFTVVNGDSVVCTFTNTNGQGAGSATTRTQGFWATHTSLSDAVWNGWVGAPAGSTPVIGSGDEILCTVPITAIAAAGQNILMGGFWANVSQLAPRGKRTPLDQARMQMLQQYLAAVLNVHAFGSGSETLLFNARTAYCGGDVGAIKAQIGILDAFNSSGDNQAFTPGSSASPQESRSEANIPYWNITNH